MKLNKALLAVVLAFIIAFSSVGLLQRQKQAETVLQASAKAAVAEKLDLRIMFLRLDFSLPNYDFLMLLTVFNTGGTFTERAPLPDNACRTEIYSFIQNNPGVQFRAICGGLGLSIGVVQFHLAQLMKSGLITSIRNGKYKRFFASGRFSRKEMETVAALRLSTVKSILKALLEGKRISHHELAVRLSISSQGLTWQMTRLRETGLVQENRNGLSVNYALDANCVPLVTQAMSIIET